jgi:hypothetical protein
VDWQPYAHYEPVLHWTRGEGLVGGPGVLRDDLGIYHLWYSYHPENKWGSGREIGYARSIDGIRWERFGGNPVLSGGGEDVCRNPDRISVLEHDGLYHMWTSGPHIFYATSKNGIDWDADGKVAFDKDMQDMALAPKAVIVDGRFLMSFHTYDWDKRCGTLRFAASTDGRNWTTGFLPPLQDATAPSQLPRIDGKWTVFFTRRFAIWAATIPAVDASTAK